MFATRPRGCGSTTIVHPQVGAEFARRLAAAIAAQAPLVVLDIPLLFEGRESGTRQRGRAQRARRTVVVWVPEAVQIERQIAARRLHARRGASSACARSSRSTASASSPTT